MQFVQKKTEKCKMKEKQTRNGLRLLLTLEHIKSVKQALKQTSGDMKSAHLNHVLWLTLATIFISTSGALGKYIDYAYTSNYLVEMCFSCSVSISDFVNTKKLN